MDKQRQAEQQAERLQQAAQRFEQLVNQRLQDLVAEWEDFQRQRCLAGQVDNSQNLVAFLFREIARMQVTDRLQGDNIRNLSTACRELVTELRQHQAADDATAGDAAGDQTG